MINDFIFAFYNVVFTALPVLILAIFDRSLNRATLENNPRAYASVAKGALFNGRIFSLWIARAVVHAGFISLVVLFCVSDTLPTDQSGMMFSQLV